MQSIAIFPCSGTIFLCLPSTAGYDAIHSSNGTSIDGASLSVSKTNRLDTGLKKRRPLDGEPILEARRHDPDEDLAGSVRPLLPRREEQVHDRVKARVGGTTCGPTTDALASSYVAHAGLPLLERNRWTRRQTVC